MIAFRCLELDDLELLVQLRMDFSLDGRGPVSAVDRQALEIADRTWLSEHLDAGRYLACAGFMGSEAVCGAGLLLYALPPDLGILERRVGHVLNFYTRPQWRRQGFGREMMAFLQDLARERGLCRLVLNASAMGEALYLQAGFADPHCRSLLWEPDQAAQMPCSNS